MSRTTLKKKKAIELFTYTQHSGNVEVFDSSDDAIRAHYNFTLNGGTVNVTSRNGDTNGICATNDITINGGTVNATGNTSGIFTDGNVTINGGTVNAISIHHLDGIIANNVTINGGTVTSDNIWSPTVTLGWSNITDCITVSSFSYSETPTVSVKSGQAFYYENGNETVTVRGTLNSNQINAIGGKTLRPLTPVSYVDGSGNPYSCGDYTVLKGSETTLEAGWYVVNNDITYDSTLTLNGNVNLILCNGKTMTINPGSGNSICGLIDKSLGNALTIYGQTLDSDTAGTLDVTNNDEDKNAIELSTYTQYSGNVVVSDSNDDAIYAYGDFTINGGTINVTADVDGIDANGVTINGGTVTINSIYTDIVTINGGTVNTTSITADNVTVNGGTVTSNSISSSTVTLGWSNLTDFITVYSYSAPIVSVKNGQAFCYQNGNDTVIIRGTLNSDQIEAISGKTLRPYTSLVTQTIALVSGYNTVSTCLDVTLDEIKAALVSAFGETTTGIKVIAPDGSSSTYSYRNGTGYYWRGNVSNWDVTQFLMIYAPVVPAGAFVLEGVRLSSVGITIVEGYNCITYPCDTEMPFATAFAGFAAVNGDKVIAPDGNSATYNGTTWRGQLSRLSLVPGAGYTYFSASATPKTLTFPSSGGSK